MHVLLATAELVPLAKVGGLAEASTGLVRALREQGARVDVVLPDYGFADTRVTGEHDLDVPYWAGPAVARTAEAPGIGPVILIETPGIRRPHPYVDPHSGWGWPDNDQRFLSFSAAVAALTADLRPDVLHLNDWHTAATSAFLTVDVPVALTIHNLSHQGQTDRWWLDRLGPRAGAYAWYDHTNLLAGGISLADRVVAVSPNYAREIVRPEGGCGLHDLLATKGEALIGFRNGIDTERWNPRHDEHLPASYSADDLSGKELCNKELRRLAGFEDSKGPVLGLVARFVHQKGIDLVLPLAAFLRRMPAHLVLVGAGESHLVEMAKRAAAEFPERVWLAQGYNDHLAHLTVAGSDLVLMPSRFEPCGLTQMEAMAYGSIPVVTDVGGLHDTVIDTDRNPKHGTGFVADHVDPVYLLDALNRGVRGWGNPRRRTAVQRRGMRQDWSWEHPARAHLELYDEMLDR